MEKIKVLCHSSIKIMGEKIIYIDPFHIEKEEKDADYIFCTHSHYDHFSPEDIKKLRKQNTKLVVVEDLKEKAFELVKKENVILVKPNRDYQIDNLKVTTTYAYNVTKPFHPRENNWVGYRITTKEKTYYIAGDTDNIPEIQKIKADVALLPIGGTYTMDYQEAAKLANAITVSKIIPIHYGTIVGKKEDAESFKKLVKEKEIEIQI